MNEKETIGKEDAIYEMLDGYRGNLQVEDYADLLDRYCKLISPGSRVMVDGHAYYEPIEREDLEGYLEEDEEIRLSELSLEALQEEYGDDRRIVEDSQ